jgi:hypothetical protein
VSSHEARMEVDLNPFEFTQLALREGFGDGLPCIPPTEGLVSRYLEAAGHPADEVVAVLPPTHTPCTVELVAINAAMTGARPEAMPFLCSTIATMAVPDFDLGTLNTTTASSVPAVIVNGPIRHDLDIPFQGACFGGAPTPAAAIGRAIRLVMRNVAGQTVGMTSACVFGQPARTVGLVVGEWEERSPWAPLAERRGVSGNAITVYGCNGTANVTESLAERGEDLLQYIGQSLGYMGNSGYCVAAEFAQVAVAINPIWASEIIARDVPSIEDVQERLWTFASMPIDMFPPTSRPPIERLGRIRENGRVHVVPSPEDVLVFVCGGLGNLHACIMPGFGPTVSVTRAVAW